MINDHDVYAYFQLATESRPTPTTTASSAAPPPPPEFSDILMQQKYQQKLLQQQQQKLQQQLQQQISAAMRLGVNEQQFNAIRNSVKANQQQPQHSAQQQLQSQFVTLTRHPPNTTMASTQQQFATLTRHQQQSQQQQLLQQRHNYSDYTKLTVQNRLIRQTSSSRQPLQQQSHQSLFTRKAVIEWTADDVQEWLSCIGMAEHSAKFEFFNGAKLMRLDNKKKDFIRKLNELYLKTPTNG